MGCTSSRSANVIPEWYINDLDNLRTQMDAKCRENAKRHNDLVALVSDMYTEIQNSIDVCERTRSKVDKFQNKIQDYIIICDDRIATDD